MGNVLSQEEEEIVQCDYPSIEEKEHIEDLESFDFAVLPTDLKYKIVDKFTYKEFAALDQTSRIGHAICWQKNYSMRHEIAIIYVNKKTVKIMSEWNYFHDRNIPFLRWHVAARKPTQIVAYEVNFTSRVSSGRMQAVAKLFEENKTKADLLCLKEHITFKPADLDRLIKAIKPSQLRSDQFVPREFFEVEAVQNIGYLCLSSCGLTDDELLGLRCENIRVENDFVSARGLNRFLKQWKRKEKEMKGLSITFDTSFGTRNVEDILDGLDPNPIWTPEMHEHSLIGKINREEFSLMLSGDPDHMYSLCRSDDIEDMRFLFLSQGSFSVICGANEASCLLGYLTEDQYYLVCKKCMCCGEEFCEHRRRHSTQRLKMFFPRLYNCALCTLTGMMYTFGSLRIEKVLLGERPFTRPPPSVTETTRQEVGVSDLFIYVRVLFFDHV